MIAANKGPKSRKRSGWDLRQFRLVVSYLFPGRHVESLHLVPDPLADRRQLTSEFMLLEDPSAAADKKRAEREQGHHDAGHACFDELPVIEPHGIIVSDAREASGRDAHHGDGETEESPETDLLGSS